MSWIFLMVAICSEVAGTTSMKLSEGFTKLTPSLAMVVCYAISLAALTFALKQIDVGVAYAIWSGMGTLLIALIGIAVFHEQVSPVKVISLLLVIAGVIGLKLSVKAAV
jgi:small multidrug resistance pump